MTSASGSRGSPISATKCPRTSGNHQRRKYKGARQLKSGRWISSIKHKRKHVYIGTFDTEEDAAIAFDEAALRFRGSCAVLNFPERTKYPPTQKGGSQFSGSFINSRNKTSKKYRGIQQTRSGKWSSRIYDPSKHTKVHLGTFETAEDAALAYDEAALKFQGPNARLNFPDRGLTRIEAPASEEKLNHTLQAGRGQGSSAKNVSADEAMTVGSDTRKYAEIITQDLVIKAIQSDENLFKLEENGLSVEAVRQHVTKLEKLQKQFEDVKGEIAKRVTEKAEIEAMKEAKDHQIASLMLKRIVLEEDIADVERDFQTSVASLGITDGVNLDIGSISTESSWRNVGLRECSNIKWNKQVLSKEVTSQVDSSSILEKNGDNLLSDKCMVIRKDLDAKKNPAGQLSSSGAYGSVTRVIDGLLSQRKKLLQGSRSLSLMGKHPKKGVLKSDPTTPQIIDLEDENDSPERLAIVPFVEAKEVTGITRSVLSKDKSSRTIQFPKADDKCTLVHFASSSEEKSSRPMPFIYLEEDGDQDTEQVEQLQVLTNESDKLDSLGSGGQLETKSGEEVHKKKGGRPRKFLGGYVLSGNIGVVEEPEKPGYSGSDGQLQMKTGEEVQRRKRGRPRKILEGSEKPDYSGSNGQLQMKSGEKIQKSDGQLQMKTACKEVQKRKGKRPQKFDGFVLPSNVPRKRKKRTAGKELQKRKRKIPRKFDAFVLPSNFPRKRKKRTAIELDAEYSLSKSQETTIKEKDAREQLVGSRIKVWWPDDQQYYEGIVESYDFTKKKHKVAYLDGYIENLILKKERWLRDDEKSDSQQDQMVPSASAMPAAESEIKSKGNKDREHEKAASEA